MHQPSVHHQHHATHTPARSAPAGKSSDINYYLNSHHIDIHNWSIQHMARPVRVVAMACTGVAETKLDRPCEDTITLMAQWQNTEGTQGTALYTSSWITAKVRPRCHLLTATANPSLPMPAASRRMTSGTAAYTWYEYLCCAKPVPVRGMLLLIAEAERASSLVVCAGPVPHAAELPLHGPQGRAARQPGAARLQHSHGRGGLPGAEPAVHEVRPCYHSLQHSMLPGRCLMPCGMVCRASCMRPRHHAEVQEALRTVDTVLPVHVRS